MGYNIRLFIDNDYKVFKEYNFHSLPYMPRIGEIITVTDIPYKVINIDSSFDQLNNGCFIIDYILHKVEW